MKRTYFLATGISVLFLGQLLRDPPRLFHGRVSAQSTAGAIVDPAAYQDLRWRTVGPHRGGRSTAVAGVRTQPNIFYMGATGGGGWKTENHGGSWSPACDGPIA